MQSAQLKSLYFFLLAFAASSLSLGAQAQLPMFIDLDRSHGKILPPQFQYSINAEDELNFGGKVVRTQLFRLELESRTKRRKDLRFYWPPNFLPAGELEVKSAKDNGREKRILRASISEKKVEAKVLRLGRQKASASSFLIEDLSGAQIQALLKGPGVQVCFWQSGSDSDLRFCSGTLLYRPGELGSAFVASRRGQKPKVIINGQAAEQAGIVSFSAFDQPLDFQANLPGGDFYRIRSQPKNIELIEALRTHRGSVLLKGKSGPPTGPKVRLLDGGEWQVEVPPERSQLVVFGSGDVPFICPIVFFGRLPNESERVWLEPRTKLSTYSSKIMVGGRAPKQYKLSSRAGEIQPGSAGQFRWQLSDLKRGQFNRRSLTLEQSPTAEPKPSPGDEVIDDEAAQSKIVEQYFNVYRGYSVELSSRMSGVVANSDTGTELLILGEFAGLAWFENLAGLKNYWLSERRWGASARYFGTLQSSSNLFKMQSFGGDARYRFTPGVWAHDGSWGSILGYQQFQYASFTNADMVGAGLFWARPMPEFFDQVFNLIPWFRYPKWVDAEFVYFGLSPSGSVGVGNTFRLAFHGKMNLTSAVFLEAGFGVYNIDFRDYKNNQQIQFAISYGTAGLGVNF